jgi:hypothetical protein
MSMSRDQLLRCLNDPLVLNERTLGELKEILEEYPYFQSVHLLYAKNLQKENNFRFESQLKTCAVYATDRAILYHLLHARQSKQVITPAQKEESPLMNADLLSFEHTEKPYLLEETANEEQKPLAELAKEIGHLAIKKEKANDPEQNNNLIDRFINENPPFVVRQKINPSSTKDTDKQIDSPDEGEEFITETLARIYMKQGLYQKSITAFQRLSLKYPEKSVYFARQIEEVTNLINK